MAGPDPGYGPEGYETVEVASRLSRSFGGVVGMS